MFMLSQETHPHTDTSPEHHRAAAVDMLLAARDDYARAARGRDRAILTAARYLSQRRIAEVTGWDRGSIRRTIAAAE